ncbi:hypothetical protein JVU11DRAFT_1015 [Chiua virens]|nr:hypothetical protein JVU11DRAFT_1015 [Chiua virens]
MACYLTDRVLGPQVAPVNPSVLHHRRLSPLHCLWSIRHGCRGIPCIGSLTSRLTASCQHPVGSSMEVRWFWDDGSRHTCRASISSVHGEEGGWSSWVTMTWLLLWEHLIVEGFARLEFFFNYGNPIDGVHVACTGIGGLSGIRI